MKYKINVSLGELVDKISILEIKLKKIKNFDKLKNVRKEFETLTKIIPEYQQTKNYQHLLTVNSKLWRVEDKLRKLEANKDFNEEFIDLARSVYKLNDKRASLKKEINIEYNSDLVEEKDYVNYQ